MRQLFALVLCIAAFPAWAVDCTVGVYGGTPSSTGGPVQVALTLLDTLTAASISSSKAATSSGNSTGRMPAAARLVRVKCNGVAHFLISDDGTNATTSDQSVETDAVEYFGISSGQYIEFIEGT